MTNLLENGMWQNLQMQYVSIQVNPRILIILTMSML
jgi:hypothetical protein